MSISKVMIATPIHSKVSVGFMDSLLSLQKKAFDRNFQIVFEKVVGSSLIHDARNRLADRFLKSDCTHLFFIDDDIVFSPKQFFDIIDHINNTLHNKSVLGGICPKKNINWEMIYFSFQQGKKDLFNYLGDFAMMYDYSKSTPDFESPIEVEGLGTGFMCIPRYVLQELCDTQTCSKYISSLKDSEDDSYIYSFFDFGKDVNTNLLIGEDLNFCKKVRSKKLKIFALPWLFLGHEGSYLFRACYKEVYELSSQYFKEQAYKNKKIK